MVVICWATTDNTYKMKNVFWTPLISDIHLNVNAIELIETRPSSRTGQSFEKLSHCHKIQLIGTVEDHALYSESFGQVFGCFSFSSAYSFF